MSDIMYYDDALAELQACERALKPFKPRLVCPTGKAPILAELQFGSDQRNLTLRMIDLDHGMWSFAIASPNKHGIMHAHVAVWYGREIKDASSLLFCPGCGTQSSSQCRHAPGYQAFTTSRKMLSTMIRQKLIQLLKPSI